MREASKGLTREIVELAGWSFDNEHKAQSHGVEAHEVTKAIEAGKGDEEPEWSLVDVICPDQAYRENLVPGDYDEFGDGFNYYVDDDYYVGDFPVIHPDGSIHFAEPGMGIYLVPIHGDEANQLRAELFRNACECLLKKTAA